LSVKSKDNMPCFKYVWLKYCIPGIFRQLVIYAFAFSKILWLVVFCEFIFYLSLIHFSVHGLIISQLSEKMATYAKITSSQKIPGIQLICYSVFWGEIISSLKKKLTKWICYLSITMNEINNKIVSICQSTNKKCLQDIKERYHH